jgi:hypothetical protein
MFARLQCPRVLAGRNKVWSAARRGSDWFGRVNLGEKHIWHWTPVHSNSRTTLEYVVKRDVCGVPKKNGLERKIDKPVLSQRESWWMYT